ncbi:TIM barrel protein [Photobacterium sp. OFAV2-7]|uniref:sugar phosphate isomerase/epimerase family protein n=1 Tax=Photobacterium sp. OFAV2-7 TaxID=2917748 RepID=UPI001EF67285|nr:sugar phosphate isomerase/epimerase [Photobacterium sp. OFAV2-7]
MKLSISNIAWDVAQDEEVADLLIANGVSAIDIAPSKYFDLSSLPSEDEVLKVKRWWNNKGISIIGMQSLLYGTKGLNVFGSKESQSSLLEHLEKVCSIAETLGAEFLVFGSPKNRDRMELTDDQVNVVSNELFYQLGNIASNYGVTICLEPNPRCYGANFMVDSFETAKVVDSINHPSIKMQLDTGAMCINAERPNEVIPSISKKVGHIHLSEPNLVPLIDEDVYKPDLSAEMNKHLSNEHMTIEMLTSCKENALHEIASSIAVAKKRFLSINCGL